MKKTFLILIATLALFQSPAFSSKDVRVKSIDVNVLGDTRDPKYDEVVCRFSPNPSIIFQTIDGKDYVKINNKGKMLQEKLDTNDSVLKKLNTDLTHCIMYVCEPIIEMGQRVEEPIEKLDKIFNKEDYLALKEELLKFAKKFNPRLKSYFQEFEESFFTGMDSKSLSRLVGEVEQTRKHLNRFPISEEYKEDFRPFIQVKRAEVQLFQDRLYKSMILSKIHQYRSFYVRLLWVSPMALPQWWGKKPVSEWWVAYQRIEPEKKIRAMKTLRH